MFEEESHIKSWKSSIFPSCTGKVAAIFVYFHLHPPSTDL